MCVKHTYIYRLYLDDQSCYYYYISHVYMLLIFFKGVISNYISLSIFLYILYHLQFKVYRYNIINCINDNNQICNL